MTDARTQTHKRARVRRLVHEMRRNHLTPSQLTFNSLMAACATAGEPYKAKEVCASSLHVHTQRDAHTHTYTHTHKHTQTHTHTHTHTTYTCLLEDFTRALQTAARVWYAVSNVRGMQ